MKVERPGFGDIGRYVGVSVNGLSALAQMCNRGKRSLALDVHQPAGREILLQLAAAADVVVQNFRPGVVERLGIGYDDVRAVNERVVYASLSGFGPTGPYAGKGAYDTVIQAYGGFAANQADANRRAALPEPDRGRQGDRALRARRRSPPRCSPASAPARARTCSSRCSTRSCRSSGPTRPATRCCRTPTARSRRASSANFRPFHFRDGWGICTPTSDADFAGMCKAFGVDGYDDPRVATIGQRVAAPRARCASSWTAATRPRPR